MKRFLAIILAAMFVLCSTLTAFAEDPDSSTDQPPQMEGETPGGTPPEMPEGGFPGGSNGTPPEKPDGQPGGTPPEKPDGQPGGTPPEKPDGQPGGPGGAPGNVPGGQQGHAEGNVYTADQDDQSAVDVSGSDSIVITDASVLKTGGSASSADAASFRGVNSAVRVYDQATLAISNSTIEATAPNATGVFAYDGGTINISDCTVNVTGGGAGGVQVAGGGTLYGQNLTVTSASKAAIRSDRGGGILVLDGGTYTSTGTNGCPAIYSTAEITVRNAQCVSEQSRAVIIEGMNSVTLENVAIEGNDQSTKQGSIHANVLLYQSASGDAKEGTSVFSMTGGTITSHSGAMFYCTNTASVINLEDAALNLSEDGSLLIVSAGRWGKDGRNGGRCTLNAEKQALAGSVTVDSISTLSINMTESDFTGSINAGQEGGTVHVAMDDGSSWTLTGDSYITSFSGDLQNVHANGYRLFADGTEIL